MANYACARDYSEAQRNRNRLSIIRTTMIPGAIVLISGTMQSWSLSSFVVAGVAIGLTLGSALCGVCPSVAR